MKNPIYLNHDYRTRDGHGVHIASALRNNDRYPIIGELTHDDGLIEPCCWTRTGCFDFDQRNHPYDLVKDITHA